MDWRYLRPRGGASGAMRTCGSGTCGMGPSEAGEGRRPSPRDASRAERERAGPRAAEGGALPAPPAGRGSMPRVTERHRPDSNRGIRVLQTLALPLGDGAETGAPVLAEGRTGVNDRRAAG